MYTKYFQLKDVKDRRISEKTQEIYLYCSQKNSSMTPRAFELARISLEQLLDNIADRYPYPLPVINEVRSSITPQEMCVAKCTVEQAKSLAISAVTKYIPDDLNLYPVTAEKKISLAKVRGQKECDIPIDEMTNKDIIYVAYAIAEGECLSKATNLAVFNWFKEIGLDPVETRVFSYIFKKQVPVSIKSLPQQDVLGGDYRKAAKSLVEKGFISEFPDDTFCVTETTIV